MRLFASFLISKE